MLSFANLVKAQPPVDPLVTLLVAVVGLAAWLAVRAVARRRAYARTWHVGTRTRDDGTHVIVLEGPNGAERVVREVTPGLGEAALTAELRSARADAFLQADQLNRPARPKGPKGPPSPAGPEPVARTRS